MAAFLVPVEPGLCVIPLEKAIVLIGRQSDCDVSLTQSRKVSRRHCCLAQVNNQIIARDLGSTNGIYLNGDRIKKQCRLRLGDELMIGDLRFRLQNDPNPPGKAGKPAKARAANREVPPETIRESSRDAVAGKATPVVREVPGGALPSMDIPVILPEEGRDFVVEPSLLQMSAPRRDESGPLVPFPEPSRREAEDDVIPLGSDSNL